MMNNISDFFTNLTIIVTIILAVIAVMIIIITQIKFNKRRKEYEFLKIPKKKLKRGIKEIYNKNISNNTKLKFDSNSTKIGENTILYDKYNNKETNGMLKLYHIEGLSQSKISFCFSLVFAILGFMVIIASILSIDESSSFLEQRKAFICLVSGSIIEIVSILFFIQSNKSRVLMNEFLEKLRKDEKLNESLNLSLEIRDSSIQDKLKTILSLNFAEAENIKDLLPLILVKNENSADDKANNLVANSAKAQSNEAQFGK